MLFMLFAAEGEYEDADDEDDDKYKAWELGNNVVTGEDVINTGDEDGETDLRSY